MRSLTMEKFHMLLFLLLTVATGTVWQLILAKAPIGLDILTKSGTVRGTVGRSRDGREFYAWKGIPYAKPPVGNLRFEDPQPIGQWNGIWDATYLRFWCAQAFVMAPFAYGSEDCLYLNIYTPKNGLTLQSNLPVMFYIHGGAYAIGGGIEQGPEFFMDEDLILVTLNYRLGIFGFLSTGDTTIRGNMGLKDQLMALKWVHENIRFFGGDPNQVTLAGESAGGASVVYQMAAQKGNQYFQRAMALSGAAGSSWSLMSRERMRRQVVKVAMHVDCPTVSSLELVRCLKKLSTLALLDAIKMDTADSFLFSPHLNGEIFVPTVEVVKDANTFLSVTPLEAARSGNIYRVPMMIGMMADEGLLGSLSFHADTSNMSKFEKNMIRNIKKVCGLTDSNPVVSAYNDAVANKIHKFYFPSKTSTSTKERLEQFTRMFSDCFFNYHVHETATACRMYSPVYMYLYTRNEGPSIASIQVGIKGKLSRVFELLASSIRYLVRERLFRQYVSHRLGASHADDVWMMFPIWPLDIFKVDKAHPGYTFSKDFVRLLSDFVTNREPLQFRGLSFLPAEPTVQECTPILSVNNTPSYIQDPIHHRVKVMTSNGVSPWLLSLYLATACVSARVNVSAPFHYPVIGNEIKEARVLNKILKSLNGSEVSNQNLILYGDHWLSSNRLCSSELKTVLPHHQVAVWKNVSELDLRFARHQRTGAKSYKTQFILGIQSMLSGACEFFREFYSHPRPSSFDRQLVTMALMESVNASQLEARLNELSQCFLIDRPLVLLTVPERAFKEGVNDPDSDVSRDVGCQLLYSYKNQSMQQACVAMELIQYPFRPMVHNFHNVTIIATSVATDEEFNGPVASFSNETGDLRFAGGCSVRILDELSHILNFSGVGIGYGDAEKLVAGEADLSIYLEYISMERLPHLHPLLPLCVDRLEIFFQQPPPSSEYNIFFHPFSKPVWQIIVATAIALPILHKAFHLISPETNSMRWRLYENPTSQLQVIPTLADFILCYISILCQHGILLYNPRKWSQRLLFFSALLFSYLLYAAYCAKLVSVFAVEIYPISSVNQVVSHGYTILAEKSFHYMLMDYMIPKHGSENETEKILESSYKDDQDSIQKVLLKRKRYAYVETKDVVTPLVRAQHITDRTICKVLSAVEIPNAKLYCGFNVIKGSPLKESFNGRLAQLMERGLVFKHFAHLYRLTKYKCQDEPKGPAGIELNEIISALVFLGIAAVSSAAIAVAEFVVWHAASRSY